MVNQGTRRFALMRWGLIPSWVKDPQKFSLLINARAETVLDKPAFRNAIKRRRCLVPADGYYEWQRRGAGKQPYFIHPRNGTLLGLAALAETWVGPNGEELDTVAIITAAATESMAALHDRVPVAIDPADFDRWLDCAGVTADEAATLLHAPADGTLIWHPVSTAVNKVANDNAQLILPMVEEPTADATNASAPQPLKKVPLRKPPLPPADSGQGSLF
jgi:putative SOS response-associated peptidase YedK